ncbi:substrate-binding periplasmic protein [Undibacterium sp. TJN19]|uniref:substrate-binding periplasmic protein n=1 Tax=Undibacterium sp. TJN19 TaxID=3413055 RepID=UPI003BEF5E04
MRAFFLLVSCLMVCLSAYGRESQRQQGSPHFSSSLVDDSDSFAASQKLLDKLCRQIGLTCTLTAYPSGRAIKMLQDGENAGELPRFEEFHHMVPTAIRVPTALGQLSFSALTHDKNLAIKNLADLAKQKVFYVRGNAVIAAHKELENLIPVNSEYDCAYMVLRKHGDACIMTKALAIKILGNSHISSDSYLLQDLFSKPVYLFLSPQHKHLLLPFDDAIKHLRPEEKLMQ